MKLLLLRETLPVIMDLFLSSLFQPLEFAQKFARRSAQACSGVVAKGPDGQQFIADRLLAMHQDLKRDPENPDPDEFNRLGPLEDDIVAADFPITKRYVPDERAEKPWDEIAIVRIPRRPQTKSQHILSGVDGTPHQALRSSLPSRATGGKSTEANSCRRS